jgi:hypothetical protein
MNRQERLDDINAAVLAALTGWQAETWSAMPARILSYDATKETVSAEITIKCKVVKPDNSVEWQTISPCVDCPVIFPSGGGFTLTFPIAVGDECLLIFASRCIDAWWQSGGVQQQVDIRMHDLSDGFALIGPRSIPRVHSPHPRTDRVELRSDDRSAYIAIRSGTNVIDLNTTGDVQVQCEGVAYVSAGTGLVASVVGDASVTATGTMTLTAPTVNIVGNVSITGTLSNNGVNVGSTHVHGGVQTGGGNSAVPH